MFNDDMLYEIAHVLASNGYKAALRRMEIALGKPKGFKELPDPVSFMINSYNGTFTIEIETKDHSENIDISWGDGQHETKSGNKFSHTYSAGKYLILISGLKHIYFPERTTKIYSIGGIISTNRIFKNIQDFNSKLNLDTSRVVDMSMMFYDTWYFDQDVKFNTSEVKNMRSMFKRAAAFNKPVNFNTTNVIDMHGMFQDTYKFNQPVSFNTSNVIDMSCMFKAAEVFNKEVNLSTENVTTMCGMFECAYKFNKSVNFDTGKVTDMSYMFFHANNFNRKVNFNTQNVTDMSHMFEGAGKFNKPVNFNTDKVTNICCMFKNADNFKKNINFAIKGDALLKLLIA